MLVLKAIRDGVITFIVTLALVASLFCVSQLAPANAETPGCTTDLWGFLASQRRTICDSARRADGSWERLRIVWTPAHQVPSRTSCYGYSFVSCTTYGGYFVEQSVQENESYNVNDGNVLATEPGWICCTNIAARQAQVVDGVMPA